MYYIYIYIETVKTYIDYYISPLNAGFPLTSTNIRHGQHHWVPRAPRIFVRGAAETPQPRRSFQKTPANWAIILLPSGNLTYLWTIAIYSGFTH